MVLVAKRFLPRKIVSISRYLNARFQVRRPDHQGSEFQLNTPDKIGVSTWTLIVSSRAVDLLDPIK